MKSPVEFRQWSTSVECYCAENHRNCQCSASRVGQELNMSENKSRLSRMRNVRVNAAGLLRRAPSFLPDSAHPTNRIGVGVGLTRSNSSSSTFYVQLPASTERKSVVAYRPVISSLLQHQTDSSHDSETSGCESGRYSRLFQFELTTLIKLAVAKAFLTIFLIIPPARLNHVSLKVFFDIPVLFFCCYFVGKLSWFASTMSEWIDCRRGRGYRLYISSENSSLDCLQTMRRTENEIEQPLIGFGLIVVETFGLPLMDGVATHTHRVVVFLLQNKNNLVLISFSLIE